MMRSGTAATILAASLAAALGLLGYQTFAVVGLRGEVADLRQEAAAARAQLEIVAGEVTRFRIEQRAQGQGARALIEKLEAYAPQLADARVAEPQYRFAKQEMEAVLRAFASLGEAALPCVLARIEELDPVADYDRVRGLLEAATHAAPDAGRNLVVEVLQGRRLPSARLRGWAAQELVGLDPKLAQQTLRQILLTESARGIDPDRAVAANLPHLDPAAVATTGFYKFVLHYLRTEDPQTDDTLLQVLTRTTTDPMTLQEIVEALGARRCARAAKHIEALYRNPPGYQNPLFLNKCLTALWQIRGEEARPFLEAELARATNDVVAGHIQHLLKPQ